MANDNITRISQLLDEKLAVTEDRLNKRLNGKLTATEQRLNGKLAATEKRLNKKIINVEYKLKKEISSSGSMVMGEIGKFMEDHLFPMIEEKADKTDIDRIERKLDKFIDTSMDHENRIEAIEHIPSIAHQIKKSK